MKRLALVLLLPLAAGAGDLKVTARPAFGGFARPGEWTAVRIEVENTAESATLEARIEGPDSVSVRDISAPSSSRRIHWIPVRASTALACTVRRGGEVLLEQRLETTLVKSSTRLALFIAVTTLGAPADKESDLRGVLGEPDDIPDFSDAFAAFDAVVVRFPAPVLSPEQFEAIRRWTLNGGSLVVCAGSEAPAAGSSPLGSLLPVRVTGVTSADSLAALDSGIPRPDSPFPVAEFEILAGTVPAPFGGERAAGLGRCLFLGVDPHLRPVSDWGKIDTLWRELVRDSGRAGEGLRKEEARAAPLPDRFEIVEKRYREFEPLGLEARSVSMNVFFGLLIGYLVVIGPLDYFILRRAGRLPWTWVTLPVAVVSFCAAAWVLAARDPERRDYATVVGVIDVWPDAVRERSLWILTVPTPGARSVTIPSPEARLRPVAREGRFRLRSGPGREPVVFRSGTTCSIENLDMEAWTATTVLALVDHHPATFGLARRGTRWEMRAPGTLERCALESSKGRLLTGDLKPGDLLPEAAAPGAELVTREDFPKLVEERLRNLLYHTGDAAFLDAAPHDGRRVLSGWLDRPPLSPAYPGPHTLRARYLVRVHLEESP